MAAIKTSLAHRHELKVGSIFIFSEDERYSYYKITDLIDSKPGKHGSAKSLISAKNIINGKNLAFTFKDVDEKKLSVVDFNYQYLLVESIEGVQVENYDRDSGIQLEEALRNVQGLTNDCGHLHIKFSQAYEEDPTLIFWGLEYR